VWSALFFVSVVKNAFGYDDALDVFGVHCIGGIVGALGTGILVSPMLGGTGIMDYATGKIADYDMWTQLTAQGKAVGTTLVWDSVLWFSTRSWMFWSDCGPCRIPSGKVSISPTTASAPTICSGRITARRAGIRRGQIPGTVPAVMERPWRKPRPLSCVHGRLTFDDTVRVIVTVRSSQ
jgi:hypothetical protein